MNPQIFGQEPLINPSVVEKAQEHLTHWDVFSRLLKDRIVFLGNTIDRVVSNVVIAQLLFLQMQDPKKDINIYINSPGGSVSAGLATLPGDAANADSDGSPPSNTSSPSNLTPPPTTPRQRDHSQPPSTEPAAESPRVS